MDHTNVTAPGAAAQETCAPPLPASFDGAGYIAAQPHFAPIARRELMAAVNTLGRDLGLRPASIVVLDALLSCLPCGTAPIGPRTLLTVFASNATLSYRAKGLTDRQLRRHLDRLEEVGLIRRRDSANKKRFPIFQAGKIVGAFGLDLSPLLAQSCDLLQRAAARRDQARELSGLKAQVQKLRSQCLKLDLTEEMQAFVDGLRTLLRRASLTFAQARAMITELTAMLRADNDRPAPQPAAATPRAPVNVLPACEAVESEKTSGSDGQNVRHKEPQHRYTKKPVAHSRGDLWKAMKTIPQFYPEAPGSEHGFQKIIYEFGRMIGIGHNTLSAAVAKLGISQTLLLQDRMADRLATILEPDGYFAKAANGAYRERVGHGQPSTGFEGL